MVFGAFGVRSPMQVLPMSPLRVPTQEDALTAIDRTDVKPSTVSADRILLPPRPLVASSDKSSWQRQLTMNEPAVSPTNTTPATSLVQHYAPLVTPADIPYLSPSIHKTLLQYRPASYRNIVGLECIHCIHRKCTGCTSLLLGEQFTSLQSERSLVDRMERLMCHVKACRCCPKEVKEGLLKAESESAARAVVGAEGRAVFRRVWSRLVQYSRKDSDQTHRVSIDNSEAAGRGGKEEVKTTFCIGSAVEDSQDEIMTALKADWDSEEHKSTDLSRRSDGIDKEMKDTEPSKTNAATVLTPAQKFIQQVHQRKVEEAKRVEKLRQEALFVSSFVDIQNIQRPKIVNAADAPKSKMQGTACMRASSADAEVCTDATCSNKLEPESAIPNKTPKIITTEPSYDLSNFYCFDASAFSNTTSSIVSVENTSPASDEVSIFTNLDDVDVEATTNESVKNAESALEAESVFTNQDGVDMEATNVAVESVDPALEVEAHSTNVDIEVPTESESRQPAPLARPIKQPTPPAYPKPRTILDYASPKLLKATAGIIEPPSATINFAGAAAAAAADYSAKRQKTNTGIVRKSSHPACVQIKYKCPLDLLSEVCNTPSVQYSSLRTVRIHEDDANETEMVYPLNNINEDETAFMLSFHNLPPAKALSVASSTDLLLYAANTTEYNARLASTKKRSPSSSKRKLSDATQPSSEPITLEELGELIKKSKTISKKVMERAAADAVVRPDSDPRSLQAFLLADQALQNESVHRQLLQSMTLARDWQPATTSEPGPGTALSKAFLWSVYPSLELILRENMQEYYDLSSNKCMSKAQLDFNNKLVGLIKQEAASHGWVWGEGYHTDKQIRNRIRCYYKSHIQNAKKRLQTMLRNPTKPCHIQALAEHFHIIEDKVSLSDDSNYASELKSCQDGSSSSSTSDGVDGDKSSGGDTEDSSGFDISFDNGFDDAEVIHEQGQ